MIKIYSVGAAPLGIFFPSSFYIKAKRTKTQMCLSPFLSEQRATSHASVCLGCSCVPALLQYKYTKVNCLICSHYAIYNDS